MPKPMPYGFFQKNSRLSVAGWAYWSVPDDCLDMVVELREHAFIARDGILPPGRLARWYNFDWHVTDAGRAWGGGKPSSSSSQIEIEAGINVRVDQNLKFFVTKGGK